MGSEAALGHGPHSRKLSVELGGVIGTREGWLMLEGQRGVWQEAEVLGMAGPRSLPAPASAVSEPLLPAPNPLIPLI